jgi:serine/threonine protein phosphatase PrpC
MGSFLDKPKTEKTNDNGQGNNIRYGLSAMQGWRIEMEDSHSSVIGLPKPGFEEWSFFAVFDGHAGGTVSKFSSKELLSSILNADTELFDELKEIYSNNQQSPSENSTTTQIKTENNVTNNETHLDSTNSPNKQTSNNSNEETNKTNSNKKDDSNKNNTNSIEDELSSVNLTTPSKYTQSIENRLKNAIRKGFLDLDEKIRQMPEFHHGEDKSGSTAVACLISPSHVYLINCGDSRAILVSNNEVVLGTYDHKPINPNERERIQNAGGSVMIQRVNGSLAVSRALGDYEYKCVEGRGPCEQLVSPEPEIYVREREHDKDQFVVLACDGIWDVMTNDDLKEFINSRLKITNNLVQISNEILDMCLNKVCYLNIQNDLKSQFSTWKIIFIFREAETT